MRFRKPPVATLHGIAVQLQPFSETPLTPDLLLKALRDYNDQSGAESETQPQVNGQLIDVFEAAKRLSVSRSSIFRLIKRGILPSKKFGSRTLRFLEADIVFLANNGWENED